MNPVPSLSFLCAETIVSNPALHQQFSNSYPPAILESAYKDPLNILRRYVRHLRFGKKFVQLAEMGIIDPKKLLWKGLLEERRFQDYLDPFSSCYTKSFANASQILTYTIFSKGEKTKGARFEVLQSLSEDKRNKIQRLVNDIQRAGIPSLDETSNIPEYGELRYGLLSDKPLPPPFSILESPTFEVCEGCRNSLCPPPQAR